MLAISFLLGIFIAVRRAKKKGVDPNQIMDLAVIIIISAIVGSRALYVIAHTEEFRGHWLDTISPFQSSGEIGIAGLTMLGGVILAFISGYIYIKVKKLDFLKLADVILPSVGLGIFITRIGCFLNGCCFGLPGHDHLCLVFPSNSAAGSVFPQTPLIPTQLYSSLYGLIIFAALLLAEKKQKFDGQLLFLFFILYGIARFVIDFFRYYETSMILFKIGEKGISVNQGISLVFVLLGIFLLVRAYARHSKAETTV